MYYLFAGAAVLSSFLIGPLLFFLPGQTEREEGPPSHKTKSGTPTMGGIGFFASFIILSIIFVDLKYVPVILLASFYAVIGLADDLIKILKKQNLGLTFWQKIILQTLAAALFSLYLIKAGSIQGNLLYLMFWTFMIVGSANATNLTDGLDGLLAGTSALAFLSFGLVCSKYALAGGEALSFIFSGAVFAFLFFNFPKAKIFMGDVGSLSIGAALAGLAIIIRNEWLLLLIGGVFAIEALSVIIQVVAFKIFGKRVFKMSPLHHHFELLGFTEISVVLGFWFLQLVLSVLGVLIG